jgi:hypothetical protein
MMSVLKNRYFTTKQVRAEARTALIGLIRTEPPVEGFCEVLPELKDVSNGIMHFKQRFAKIIVFYDKEESPCLGYF